jgi:F-type H+-transporting ATPase subunit delta
MDSRISQRYAIALMDIGTQKKIVDTLAKDMSMILDTLHGSSELRSMLSSPVIRPDIKRKVLGELFGSRVSNDVLVFVDLLIRKGRASLLAGVAEEFQKLLDTDNGTVNADITSASELDDTEKNAIVTKLHTMVKLTVRPRFHVDPSIRGGFVAKVGDTLIDASLQHQLENLREEWKQASLTHVN